MDEDSKAAAQRTMRELLAALKIERVISIDDYNDAPLFSDPVTVTTQLMAVDALRVPLVDILQNVDAALGFETVDGENAFAVADFITDNWSSFTERNKFALTQAAITQRDDLDADVREEETADDVQAPELLREFLRDAADLKQYSLAQWRAGANNDLIDPTPVLVLIDKNFTREADAGGGKDTGEQLLAEVLQTSGSHVHAGLLTREALDDDGERAATERLRNLYLANANRVLAIGKFRLKDPTQFPAAVRTLLLVSEISEYRKLAKDALTAAHAQVLEHFDTLEDHSLVGAIAMAQKEGAFELEHPLRLAQRRYHQLITEAVRSPVAAALLPKLREGTVANYITAGKPGKQIRQLQHADTFEPSNLFNDLGLPLEVGDIFERTWLPQGVTSGATTKSSLFILLAQACDLSLRRNGSRGSVVELVLHPFEPLDEADFAKYPSKKNLYHDLGYLNQDDVRWGAKFTNSIVVPAQALDATVFRADGTAILTPATPDLRPMAEGWVTRQAVLLKWADKAINQFATAEKHLAGVSNSEEHLCRLAASYALGSMEKSRGVSVRIDSTARTLEYGLKRVARVRSDVAVNVASLTMSYAARPAFEAASVTDSP
ncbi:hypothetical protein [Microbacterium sp. VKM Ac-2923]|uniref:hypothetical protein n=1 Tax=Microbacterium sp. VKM Ac-2923 TaxID=2929476 RepID=UPI001FB3370C|nr:hypothetical protein [Microbacterium sp. VKM Ac-2923]MCJ1708375.1 hypothetical protein [Microbacterium sp. VKM Ac-2923]